jgi:hypothetical protein
MSKDYKELYDLLGDKIFALRKASIIETNAAIQFQLQEQIKQAEKELSDIEKMLRAGELKLYEFASHPNSNIVHHIWNSLEPELQDALSLAYNQTCRNGENIVKTRYVFSAIARLKPEPISELLDLLPPNSVPNLISNDVGTEKVILRRDVQVSPCVSDSLEHLSDKISEENQLSSIDIFIDLAKYGKGSSVAQFREYGVTPKKIDEMVAKLGWNILSR